MNVSQMDRASDEWHATQALRLVSDVGIAAASLVVNVVENVGRLVGDVSSDARAVADEVQALYSASVGAAAAARDAARATPRFARIVQDLLRIAAGYRLHSTLREATEEWLGPETSRIRLAALHRDGAERLYRLCV